MSFRNIISIFSGRTKRRPEHQELEKIILFIQMNHLQSLTEAIESNPALLYLCHKKRPLLYWCTHYNNTKAHMVVIQLIKKYPKENSLIAA